MRSGRPLDHLRASLPAALHQLRQRIAGVAGYTGLDPIQVIAGAGGSEGLADTPKQPASRSPCPLTAKLIAR
jgi:hypothetical protein